MTEIQSVGLWRTDKPRSYFWSDGAITVGPLVSITTAMKSIDKPALIGWAKRLTAEAAVRHLDLLHKTIELGGEQAAIDFLKKLADHKRDKSSDLGQRVHKLAEAIARKQEVQVTADELPYVEAYGRWMQEWKPSFVAAEYMVCNLAHQYGGTGDLVVRMRGESWRLDTKTTDVGPAGYKGPYPETGLQLAAAHYAEFSGLPGDPKKYAVPRADRNGVLALRGDGTYAVVPYEVTENTFQAFLAAKRVWEWLEGDAKQIVGKPITELEKAA